MITVDTSALIAILMGEEKAGVCEAVLMGEPELLISSATVTEAFILAHGRRIAEAMTELIGNVGLTVVPLTEAGARKAADAYSKWGRGFHPAGLNFGDCFAYALAHERGCPLLFVGNEFSQTDIQSALA